MRRSRALLVGFALLASGCSSVPTVMGISGIDQVPLGTREHIHEAFGTPIAVGTVDGARFEEFQIRYGCDAVVWGYRVPAFQPLEEFHIRGWGDLRVIAVQDVSGIPTKGKNLIVVANINNVLHFRLFDEDGNTVVDTDEAKLPTQVGPIADLKKQLQNLWPDHLLTQEENCQIITSVASIVGHIPPGSFELGVATVKTFGLMQVVIVPSAEADPSRHRVLRGQTLRFDYDKSGNVTKVYLNGNYLLAPADRPDAMPKHGTFEVKLW
jgi:hypothetical protein